jgi:hypothetical protein
LYSLLKWKRNSAHAHAKKMYLDNKRIITIKTQRNIFPFFSLCHIYASAVKSAHTHVNVSFVM